MCHGLFVVRAKNRQFVTDIFQRLAETSNIAMAENCEYAAEQPDPLTIVFRILCAQKTNQCLRHCESCFHSAYPVACFSSSLVLPLAASCQNRIILL